MGKVLTDPPAFRISTTSGFERTVKFSQVRNQPMLTRFFWEAVHDVQPTETEAHIIYPHIAGYRLRATLSFVLFCPAFQLPWGGDACTPDDITALLAANQNLATKRIEFYPHASLLRGFYDSRYSVFISSCQYSRQTLAGITSVNMELIGRNLVVSIPSDI